MPRSKRQPPVDERLLMSLHMTDFGPIADASVDLKPLTVFIGPNNSGKSYAALAVRAALVATGRIREWIARGRMRDVAEPGLFRGIDQALDAHLGGGEISLPGDVVRLQVAHLLRMYAHLVGQQLGRDLLCPPNELVQNGQDSLRLTVRMGSRSFEFVTDADGLGLIDWAGSNPGVKLCVEPGGSGRDIDGHVEVDGVVIRLMGDFHLLQDKVLEMAADQVVRNLAALLFGQTGERRCLYLPAGRTGIMQAHRALAASIIARAPHAGFEDPIAPRLPGGIADFIAFLLQMPSQEGLLADDARRLQYDMIGGRILLDASPAYPEILYEFDGGRIPLSQASSAVSELAPLFLYMVHEATPRDVLICEEPEAHLHPQNQRNVARLLVRLVRRGVHVVIATHSEFLLEQLSHFVQLGGTNASERQKRYAYDEDDYLQADEVSVRLFKKKRTGGYGTKSIAVTQEDGIPQDEFLSISEEMYEETLKIERELAGER